MQLENLILNFMWKNNHARIIRKTMKKRNYKGLVSQDIKTYEIDSVTKMVQYSLINRPAAKRNFRKKNKVHMEIKYIVQMVSQISEPR